MNRMQTVLAGALLLVASVPVRAQDIKVSITKSAINGPCPGGQILTAEGVIQALKPTNVVFYWQWALWPEGVQGNQPAVSYPPISHLFTSASSLTVTSPGLLVPPNYTGGLRLIAGGYVANFVTRANNCPGTVTGMGLIAADSRGAMLHRTRRAAQLRRYGRSRRDCAVCPRAQRL